MIAINTTYQLAPWADLLYACDEPWWRMYHAHLATRFAGELWTISDVARQKFGIAWILGVPGSGLSLAPDHIHAGKNSGHQAVGLCALFGVSAIALLGFDFMLGPRGERHHHGNHPRGLSTGPKSPSTWNDWVRDMALLAPGLAARGVKVLNASRRTAIKCFPRVTLETALHELRNSE